MELTQNSTSARLRKEFTLCIEQQGVRESLPEAQSIQHFAELEDLGSFVGGKRLLGCEEGNLGREQGGLTLNTMYKLLQLSLCLFFITQHQKCIGFTA